MEKKDNELIKIFGANTPELEAHTHKKKKKRKKEKP
jgi:hypothetical protein